VHYRKTKEFAKLIEAHRNMLLEDRAYSINKGMKKEKGDGFAKLKMIAKVIPKLDTPHDIFRRNTEPKKSKSPSILAKNNIQKNL